MKQSLYGAVCAVALMCAGVAAGPTFMPPAYAQSDVSFDSFHDALTPYGDWVYSDRWGEVWMPDAGADFQPYGTSGYWADTDDYGWTWVSGYPWGDIPFHYGRWVNDPDDGWMWIPGYVWSPAWVVWRGNDQMTGWMPMPPDPSFLNGGGDVDSGGLHVSIDFNDPGNFYGYRDWYGPSYDENRFAAAWIFVGNDHFADRDFHSHEAPRGQYNTFIHNTKNVTNYTVTNNIIVNRSVNVSVVERAQGHPVQRVQASAVMHRPALITKVDQGRQVQQRQRAAMPHGDGKANSAPKPTQAVVNGLSNKTPPTRGGAAGHVYSKQTVEKAQLRPTPASATQAQEPAQQQREEKGPSGNQTRERAVPPTTPAPNRAPNAAPNAAPRPATPQAARPEFDQRRSEPRQPAPTPPRQEPPKAAPQPPRPQAQPAPHPEAPRAAPQAPKPPPAARPEPPKPQAQPAPHPQSPPKAPPPKKDEHKDERKDERKDEQK